LRESSKVTIQNIDVCEDFLFKTPKIHGRSVGMFPKKTENKEENKIINKVY
jgi:hypothetical protein